MSEQTIGKMAEQINQLVKLQEIDGQIYRLNEEKELRPQELIRLEQEFKEELEGIKKLEEELKVALLKRKEKEMDLRAKEQNISKLQIQLYQLKTNKEYTTMQQEIAGIKADQSVIEEEILILMEKADAINKKMAEEKSRLQGEEAKMRQAQVEVRVRLTDIEKELADLGEKRKAITPNIDPLVLSRYEKVLHNRSGQAVVAISEGACGGCHMSLPPQVINEIRMKDRVVSCEICSRILYSPE